MNRDDLRSQLIEHLEYLRELGVEFLDLPDVSAATAQEKARALDELRKAYIDNCTRCRLCSSGRTNVVFGEGKPDAELMFIGEGPGAEEDKQGLPFVGRAGQKLNEMINAMGLQRSDVYIANIVKCRPPENRAPRPDEIKTCLPYLEHQIAIIQPKVICALGTVAAQTLLDNNTPISKIRGVFQDYRGIPLMPTYHPAYLLRNYTVKTRREVWEDMKKIMDFIKGK
jgi:uracil-DNA glycosylase family 4